MKGATPDWRFALTCLLPGLLLWLLAHPYQGIWHDARIYALAAAHLLHPEHYARDLFFVFGSQDDYTLFSPIYAGLVTLLGLDRAAMLVVLAGAGVWLFAHYLLARRHLGQGFTATLFVLAAAALSINYSPNGSTFLLNENFATARSLAMPLGLLAVHLGIAGGRQAAAFGLALFSAALHPLIGIWPLALLVGLRIDRRRFAVLAALPALAIAAVGAVGVDLPALALLPESLLATLRAPTDVLLGGPGESRLGFHGFVLVALAFGARFGSAAMRPVYQRLCLLGAGAWLAAFVTARYFPVSLAVQVQFWRAFWLLAPLAILAVLEAAAATWTLHRGSVADAWVALAAVLLLLPTPVGVALAVVLVAVASVEPLSRRCRPFFIAAAEHPRLRRGLLIGLCLIALPGIAANVGMAGQRLLAPWWEGQDLAHGLVAGGTWVTPVVAALLLSRPLGRTVSLGVVLLSLPVVAGHWDRRPAALRAAEACYLAATCAAHPFSARIRPGEVVHWPDRELRVFFALNTAGYVSVLHGTGKVFSPAKFVEWRRRNAAVAAATGPDGRLRPDLCGDPALDWLVLPLADAGTALAVVGGEGLVDCRAWRRRRTG